MNLDPTNIFIVNRSNKAACSLIKKLSSRQMKPGAVIFLSDAEFKVFNEGVRMIESNENKP